MPKIPNYKPYSPTGLNKTAKIFSPSGAKVYNAGQRGVTGKPFSKKWINQVDSNVEKLMTVGSYKKGGKVKKTGLAMVHKGERVLTKKQTKKFDKRKFERARKKYYGLK